MKASDPRHPDYDRWLMVRGCLKLPTTTLLHALVSRDVRMEMHRIWRAERCNPPVAYTDDMDRHFSNEIAEVLGARIDGSER